MQPGAYIVLHVEKAAAGGRMLARHEGRIVLVAGAIPGEHVRARVTRVARGVVYAEVDDVLAPSPDRREAAGDVRCGGHVLAHIVPERQAALKGEIIDDALRRIGRLPLPSVPRVIPSPERGYRMRARLHVRRHRIGFLREASHELCDAAATGQLLPQTGAWVAGAMDILRRENLDELLSIELAEDVLATARACHLELAVGERTERYASLAPGLTGLSACRQHRMEEHVLAGHAIVSDLLKVSRGDTHATVRLERDPRAFFQGNRFLLEPLVSLVAQLVPDGPVVDLYAGVGTFGLALAALGFEDILLVEGDAISGANLTTNALPYGTHVQVRRSSVEGFLESGDVSRDRETVIVDPPRTGLSPEAIRGLCHRRPSRIVYVSCDVATFARDARLLADHRYAIGDVTGVDLFPNTAHVESVARFDRA